MGAGGVAHAIHGFPVLPPRFDLGLGRAILWRGRSLDNRFGVTIEDGLHLLPGLQDHIERGIERDGHFIDLPRGILIDFLGLGPWPRATAAWGRGFRGGGCTNAGTVQWDRSSAGGATGGSGAFTPG